MFELNQRTTKIGPRIPNRQNLDAALRFW